MLDFGLVGEALRERDLMIKRLAPHLVRPVPFLYPLEHRFWERAYVGSGVALYDAMALASHGRRGVPMHRHMSMRRALREAPGLKPSALVGAIQYWDGQVDDARYTMTLVRTAVTLGALAANRAEVTRFLWCDGAVVGAEVTDTESGQCRIVRARRVINATGVWTDVTTELAGLDSAARVRASKGVHIVVPRDRIDLNSGLIVRTESSVMFVIPWAQHWIVGTTDTEWPLEKAGPTASAADIDYLLGRANAVLRRPLTRDDIVGVYVGLRPLVAGGNGSTARMSREHLVMRAAPGLVVIAGGKYTTYRVMASDAVDEAVRDLDRDVPASSTMDTPLVGAHGYHALWNHRARLAQNAGLPLARIESLLARYGDRAHDVIELAQAQPNLAAPLPGAEEYIGAEIAYAVSHEGSRHVDDVLERRTHIAFESWDGGVAAARAAAAIMAPHLGWEQPTIDREVEVYARRVAAERAAHVQPDDARAESERNRSEEIAPPSHA
jgi:glycerol-3-phosphate dehydrogenase